MDGRGPSSLETWDELFGEFYLRIHARSAPREGAIDQALAAVQLGGGAPGAVVLDVPCGFGRHALPLAREGFLVVGVDRSAVLLDEARARAGDGPAPELVQADYRELPFADASFDVALNLFTSLGYLGDDEDARVLAEIARVLRPNGRLVLELMHRDLLVHRFRERDWRLVGEGRLLLEQATFDPASGVAQTTQTLIDGAGDRDSRSFSVRVYTATELVAMLLGAGFAEAKCYGDLSGEPFGIDTRLVVVARR